MPRPLRCRRICRTPGCAYFKPAGIPLFRLKEVVVTLDEFEAMRLVDMDGLYQDKAAEKMRVSRQTLGRIVESARRKVAKALVAGMAIKLEGGNIEMENGEMRSFLCSACKNGWGIPYGTGRPEKCPKCGSLDFRRHPNERGFGRGFRGGRGPGSGKCRRLAIAGGKS